MGVRNAPPHAGSMLESLRGLGYAPPTALADLVDNSITANSSEVAIHLEWGGPESWIRIVDDGDGMDDAALEAGMRLGASDPRAERAATVTAISMSAAYTHPKKWWSGSAISPMQPKSYAKSLTIWLRPVLRPSSSACA